jgi:hypothetical protein
MRMRVLKNRGFARTARKQGLTDQTLCLAVAEIESGLIDARLGGGLLKKRIAKGSRGKSGGFRTIVACRRHDRLVFLYVFGKNERDNITERNGRHLRNLTTNTCTSTPNSLIGWHQEGTLIEVACDDDKAESQPDSRGGP